ncbi:MAG: hypothetical protein J7L14_01705, partial [Candidatus Diapherotrites archaeon]|nr:hypothetical protein [Candidatus Diapherotrites archaeon]
MGVLADVLAKIPDLDARFRYDFNFLDLWQLADFRRNKFVFLGKKAIREWMNEHKHEIPNYYRSVLAAELSRAIMKLWQSPELFN